MVNDLLSRVSLDYAKFMEKHLQELFPADCEDHQQFIKVHEIHIRNFPTENTSELWSDGKKVGTFSQSFKGATYTFEFTK